MAKVTTISQQAAVDMCDALIGHLNTGAGNVSITIYGGVATRPATPDTDPAGGNDLVSIQITSSPSHNPATGAAGDGTALLNGTGFTGTAGSNAGAGGTDATWFRGFDKDGTAVMDGNAGQTGEDMDLELDDKNIKENQQVQLNTWAITMPGS